MIYLCDPCEAHGAALKEHHMILRASRDKRTFAVSPKPSGAEPAEPAEPAVSPDHERTQRRCVEQEHHARHLQYDRRLELDRVLRSWTVPNGSPGEPGVRRLAVTAIDHPLSSIDFHGTLPTGQYGAGTVQIW